MQKIFSLELVDDIPFCNGDKCNEKAVASAIFYIGNTRHNFRLCEKHLYEFKNSVDEDYSKLKKYFKLQDQQKKDLLSKKEELFEK